MKTTIGLLLLLSSVITGCQSGKMGELVCYSGSQRILAGKGYIEEMSNGTYEFTVEGKRRTTNADCAAIYDGALPWERATHKLPEIKE